MIEKPESAARAMADMLCTSSYADAAAQRNAITRRLLEFYDAGQSASLARIERLEGLLMRIKPWIQADVFADVLREIDEVLKPKRGPDTVRRAVDCQECGGTGEHYLEARPCPVCDGSGMA